MNTQSTGEFFWEDVVEQVPLPGQGPCFSGLQDVLRGVRAAFPDMHWTVEEQIAATFCAHGDHLWTTELTTEAAEVTATPRPASGAGSGLETG